MKTLELLDKLQNLSKEKSIETLFQKSGMVNKYNQLDFGFFPLGKGILTSDLIHENNFKIMVLGNDFGTDEYLQDCIKNHKRESESKSPTIRNLITKLNINLCTTFFTNLHLGVRNDGKNTLRLDPLTNDYKVFCFNFLKIQLNIINPNIVICLGHDVRKSLIESSPLFSNWLPKNKTLKNLYDVNENFQIEINDAELGKRKFIVIPHPCDTRNFKDKYIEKINRYI